MRWHRGINKCAENFRSQRYKQLCMHKSTPPPPNISSAEPATCMLANTARLKHSPATWDERKRLCVAGWFVPVRDVYAGRGGGRGVEGETGRNIIASTYTEGSIARRERQARYINVNTGMAIIMALLV